MAEAALVAWVNSCSDASMLNARITSFSDLADGAALGKLAAHFLDYGGHDKKDLAAYLNVVGQADHIILGALLLMAVDGPQNQHAIGAIMTLEPEAQAVIAGLLQNQMSDLHQIAVPSAGSGSSPSENPAARRGSFQPADRGMASAGLSAGGDIDQLRSEVQKVAKELNECDKRGELARQGQKKAAAQLREQKEKLHHEEDVAQEYEREFLKFEDECRQSASSMDHMREEVRQERMSSPDEDDGIVQLKRRIDDQQRDCRALRAKQDDLQASLDHAEIGAEKLEKQNWRRTALMSKILRLEESCREKDNKLRSVRGSQFQEERVAASLEFQSQEANEELAACDDLVIAMRGLFLGSELEFEAAQSRLDGCGEELRVIKRGDVDLMSEEITMRRKMVAQLEQFCEDTQARSLVQEAEVPLLEQAIERSRADLVQLNHKQEHLASGQEQELGGEKAKAAKVRNELTEARGMLRREEDQVRLLRRDCDEAAARRQQAQEEANAAFSSHAAAASTRAAERSQGRKRYAAVPAAAAVAAAELAAAAPTAAASSTPLAARERPAAAPGRERAATAASKSKPAPLQGLAVERQILPTASGPMVAKLQEQLKLRERELVWRESQAGEAETLHQREVQLLSGAIHQLGIKYGVLLSESEAASAAEQDLQDELEEEALEQVKKTGDYNLDSTAKPKPAAKSSLKSGLKK